MSKTAKHETVGDAITTCTHTHTVHKLFFSQLLKTVACSLLLLSSEYWETHNESYAHMCRCGMSRKSREVAARKLCNSEAGDTGYYCTHMHTWTTSNVCFRVSCKVCTCMEFSCPGEYWGNIGML